MRPYYGYNFQYKNTPKYVFKYILASEKLNKNIRLFESTTSFYILINHSFP